MNSETSYGLLVSYYRNFEHKASQELEAFFNDEIGLSEIELEPLSYTSLLIVKFEKDPIPILKSFDKKLKEDPYLFQVLLKFVPLEFCIKTSLENIREIIKDKYSGKISDGDKWRIILRRRDTELDRNEIIDAAAADINNGEVDLEDSDYYIRVEILGERTYVSFSQISKISVETYRKKKKNEISVQNY
jgi:tRNA(Ser,Leu) C12 N-acetylase TAN1